MRLKTRVWIIIIASMLGLLVIAALGLYGIRQSMIRERGAQIDQLLSFADDQLTYYQSLEASGKLSREDAQNQAKAAIGAQHNGATYYFVRSLSDDVMLVHPTAQRVGQVDKGGKQPDGRDLVDIYKEELSKTEGGHPQVWVETQLPGATDNVLYPKLTGVSQFKPWGWMIGIGFFVNDIDASFWKQATFFIVVGAVVLVFLGVLILRMRGVILRQLGGEPQEAAAYMKKIANGDLAVEITLDSKDNDSLMASLKLMQMKLKNITSAIQESSEALDGQVKVFDTAAKTYNEAPTDEGFGDLLRAVKKLGKTADILRKSISRFKI